MSEKKKKKRKIGYFLIGEWMKEDFVIKQSKFLVWIAFLFTIFISNDYSFQQNMKHIEVLKDSLEHVSNENLILATKLTYASRQSQIESMLKARNIDLVTPKQPAFVIKK